jgi:hypothetical protein|tara:strand:+ start:2293 stop:2409 length:117 start_codon:yes stop_codon:yes gene_type:complete
MKGLINWFDAWMHRIIENHIEQLEQERLDYIEQVGFGD